MSVKAIQLFPRKVERLNKEEHIVFLIFRLISYLKIDISLDFSITSKQVTFSKIQRTYLLLTISAVSNKKALKHKLHLIYRMRSCKLSTPESCAGIKHSGFLY